MAQTKMQAYMDRHKLGPLFEDLMNRVLRDMPEEPMVYLLRTLYKKAGMEIPQDIRYGGLRKSVDLVRSRSPERATRGSPNAADPNSTAASREHYEKPWLTHQRRMKPRRSAEGLDASGTKSGKKRPDWQGDTKIVATSFEELWEDQDGHRRDASPGKRSRSQNDPRSSWAAVGLEGGDKFISGEYHGPNHRSKMSEEELLAAEMMRMSGREAETSQESVQLTAASGVRGQRLDSERHRRQLDELLHRDDSQKVGGLVTQANNTSDVEDEALELLESAEDLEREGVKNIPAAGYKLSKIMRERSNQPCVKLNINLSPRSLGDMSVADSMQSFEGYESDQEIASPTAAKWESEDEFESVSQVTGPRVPVWQVPDSDGETAMPRRSHGRHRKHKDGRDLSASAPEAFQPVTFSAGDLDLAANQTWSPGLNVQTEESSPEREHETDLVSGRSEGWALPDDSDAASLQDWNQRVKGRKRDLRTY